MGYDRQQFSVTNVLRCRPRNNWLEKAPWEYAALSHCRPNLDAVIAERRPRCIVALGGVATRVLTGMAGEAQGVSHLVGYVLPGPGGVPVIPNFHPAFLRRGKASHHGVFARILQRAVNVAKGTDTAYLWDVDADNFTTKGLDYAIRPSVGEVRAYLHRVRSTPGIVVSYDIETSESASLDEDAREGFVDTGIRLVQFSTELGEAIAVPWDGEFRGLIAEILATPNVKCGHNVWLFDNKVLRANGVEVRGVIHDTLAMFHHWQPDLPAHLQFAASFTSFPFPWKHLAATDIEFYGCCDADATLRLYRMLEATLRRDGLWGDETRGYIGQVYNVRPALAAMEDRGMPIDDVARVALDVEFDRAQQAVGAELAAAVPAGFGRVHPKDGYKGVPPEIKKWCDKDGNDVMGLPSNDFKESGDDGERYHYERRPFTIADTDAVTGEPVARATTRWCRVYNFNPNSWQQLLEYMDAKGHPRPKDKHRSKGDSDEPADTTNAKELTRLAHKTGDKFYLKVVEFRGLTKMRGTYVEGFRPGPDGCVHTTFTFDTAIGQTSSRNPNIQNFPKLKPTPALAKSMRKMVAAKPGHLISEWDFKSCHVLTLGFLAEDPNYIRLARLDMHSFVTGHILKLWDGPSILRESDDELRARFKWLKKNPAWKHVRDDQAKHAILGIGNGLKAKGLYERYMENFVGQKEAQKFLTIIEKELFPKVFVWQRKVQREAHEKMMLRTQFGHIRRFYEVFRWNGRKGDWGHGDQSEEAISFWLSNIAFGHIREKMKELAAAGLDARYGLFNNVHDSFMFHLREEDIEQHIAEVYPVLTSPSTVLKHPTIAPEGLYIDVEASAGRNWSEMHELALPPRTGCATVAADSSLAHA